MIRTALSSRNGPGRSARGGPSDLLYIAVIASFFLLASVPIAVEGLYTTVIRKGGQDGGSFIISFPEGGGRDPSMSIPLPGGGPVQSGSLKVSTVPGEQAPYRVSLDIGLDSRPEWSFGGGDFGGFGRQDRFVGDEATLRSLGSTGGYAFSLLLPEQAVLRNASLGIVPLPSPEGLEPWTLGLPEASLGGVDSLDTADIDGDGTEDLVYHDAPSSSLVLIEDLFGIARSVVLESSVEGPVHTRALDRTKDRAGLIVTSYVSGDSGNRMVYLHVKKGTGPMLRVLLGTNLSTESVGFSVREHDESNATVMFVSKPGGGLYTVQVDRSGNVVKRLVLDETRSLTDPYLTDIDGDGDLDVLLFGPTAPYNRAMMLEAEPGQGQDSYSSLDINTSLGPAGLAAVCDTDGDLSEELYFISDTDLNLGTVYFDPSTGPVVRSLGIDGSGASIRSLPSWDYGRGGAYDDGEGFLYITSPEGVAQVVPHTSLSGEFLLRTSLSIGPGSMISDIGPSGDVHAFSVQDGKGIQVQDIFWMWQNQVTMRDLVSGKVIETTVPSPMSGLDPRIDVSLLLGPDSGAQKVMDATGNLFYRHDLTVSGDGLFVKVTELEVCYDVTFDASSSLELLPALERSQDDFDDRFIPFQVTGSSEGSVEVGPVLLLHDAYPAFDADLPRVLYVDEDSLARTVLGLRDYITDDQLAPHELELKLLNMDPTPEGLVFLDRNMNLISHASAFPDLSGTFPFQLAVSDSRSTVLSEEMSLVVVEAEDPPRTNDGIGKVLVEEGSTMVIPLTGEGGFFWDPDGDDMTFSWDLLSVSPTNGMDHVLISIDGTNLSVRPDPSGKGSEIRLEVLADDGRMPVGASPSIVLIVEVLDVDSPPTKRAWSGPLELSEDQSLPSRVALDELFQDPDDHISECSFRTTSSDKRLVSYIGEDRGRPYLFVHPRADLSGLHKVWVEMASRGRTVAYEVPVNIRPVNDLPVVFVDSKRDLAGKGWMVTGYVEDPDDTGGFVQYMVADGQWKDAWGFNLWTFVVDFGELPPEGGYVFVRANDGEEDSATVFVKLSPPDKATLPYYEEPDDDTDDDGPGNDLPPAYYSPSPSTGDHTLLYILLGTASGLLGTLIVSILLTEVGFVTVLTVMMSAYTKLSKKDILNHEIRGLIRGYIIANPGDHYSSIKRNLDLNNGTLAYHLRVLEQNGLIKSMYDGIYKRYYPANVNISKLKKNISKQEEIFNIILENPGITMEQIGRNIGVSRQVVNYHVKNLIRAGAISYQRDDKSARFFSSETPVIPQDT